MVSLFSLLMNINLDFWKIWMDKSLDFKHNVEYLAKKLKLTLLGLIMRHFLAFFFVVVEMMMTKLHFKWLISSSRVFSKLFETKNNSIYNNWQGISHNCCCGYGYIFSIRGLKAETLQSVYMSVFFILTR